MNDLIIIGGGAAGFFAAAQVRAKRPDATILILEKTGKVLSKVKVSGGGRCNVTHNCLDVSQLLTFYPRGNPWLRTVFAQFQVSDTLKWFTNQGVRIVSEPDGRMFPESNSSQTIIDVLVRETVGKGVKLLLHSGVTAIIPLNVGFSITLENKQTIEAKSIIVSSGGHPNRRGFDFLHELGLEMIEPVPSLFTFNVSDHPWADLKGLSVSDAKITLQDSDLAFEGPLLITHWGFSGPAVLRLSAFAARILEAEQYRYLFSIDWLPGSTELSIFENLTAFQAENPKRKPDQWPQFGLPKRLWERICSESGLAMHHNWAEVGKRKILLMAKTLKNSHFHGNGKTTFKEEFVTAGGVALSEVNSLTCESVKIPGLFFAGEVLDVDGVTGGFNFQAAWSTSSVAAKSVLCYF